MSAWDALGEGVFPDEQRNSHPLPPMDVLASWHDDAEARQAAYHAHRRAHAEAIGRPYADERHSVWPR